MIVTILFFAAPFATIIHVMKVRNTESLPYHLIVSTFIVCLQWMVYGVLLKDPFIQVMYRVTGYCIIFDLKCLSFLDSQFFRMRSVRFAADVLYGLPQQKPQF